MANSIRRARNSITVGGLFLRFITATIIIMLATFFTPQFAKTSILPLLLAGIALSIFDYLLNNIFSMNTSFLERALIRICRVHYGALSNAVFRRWLFH